MDRAPRSRPDAFGQCRCKSRPISWVRCEAWQLPSLVPSRSSALDPLMYPSVYFIIPAQEHLVRTKLPPNPSAVFQSRSRVFNIWTPLQSGVVLLWLEKESTAERSPSCHTRIYARKRLVVEPSGRRIEGKAPPPSLLPAQVAMAMEYACKKP